MTDTEMAGIMEQPAEDAGTMRQSHLHPQTRVWQCHRCQQAFKKREHLVRHIRSHTKEKPFACNVCSKAYGRRDSLIRHARSHARSKDQIAGAVQPAIPSPPEVSDSASAVGHRLGYDAARSQVLTSSDQSASLSASIDLEKEQDAQTRSSTSYPVNGCQTDDASPSACSSGHDPGSSLNFGLQLDPLDMSTEPDVFGFGTDFQSHDPFWLLGEHFDLEALNSSISAAATPRPYESFPGNLCPGQSPESCDSAPKEVDRTDSASSTRKTIQNRWYTRPAREAAPQHTSLRLKDQHQVDETYRNALSNRLATNVPDNALPSADFLNLCIKFYFAKVHPVLPLVHVPLFRPSSESALLLLSICSLGALFVGSTTASARGRAIFVKLNKAILASWEVYLYRGGREALAVAQAAVLGQTFGMLSGNPNDLLLTESFHGTIIAWARQAGMFQLKSSWDAVNLAGSEDVEAKWRAWSQAEESIRALVTLHIHDSEFAAVFHRKPLLAHNSARMPRCCSDRVFSAPNASQWFAGATPIQSSAPSEQPQTDPNEFSSSLSLMTAYGILAGHVAAIHEAQCGGLGENFVQDIRRQLMSWHDTYASFVRHPNRDQSCLMVLWHEAFMASYADFDMMESVAGRDGPAVKAEDVQRIQHWVAEDNGKRCATHAMLIYKRLQAMNMSTEPAIHVPKALFYAGLVLYFHAKYRTNPPLEDDVDAPELRQRLLGQDRVDPSPAAAGNPRFDPSSVHGIVDLLRRQGHWELSRRFASTLEILIDDLADSAA